MALALVVTRTRVGMQLRAGATHPHLLGALGVDTGRLFALVAAGGAMLAGFAGAVAAPILSVEPGMGDGVLILAFVVIIIGGTGSIRGAAVAALLVGLVDTLGRSFATDLLRLVMRPSAATTAGPALASMAIYVMMAVVLAVRPRGSAARQVTIRVGSRWRCWCCSRSRAVVLPALHGEFLLFPATRIVVYAIAAVALDFVLGFGGLVSFGHAAFIGIGAYTLGIAAVHDVTDAAITLPLAAVTAGAFALVTGAIALRTSGVYFIMITLAFGQMAFFTAGSLAQYGGDDGLTLPGHSTLFGTAVLEDRLGLYYACLAVLAAALLLLGRAVRSRFGRVLRGARDAPERMRALGYDPYPYRLLAYTVSGAVTGVAGALLAELTQFAAPAYMAWPRSGDLMVAVILGGAATLWGPVLGTLGYLALSDWLADWTEHWRIVLGPLLVLAVLLRRRLARP